jgi:hypothetical protein
MKKFKAKDYASINVDDADETSLVDAIGGDRFALMNSFDWEETPEGDAYWSDMYHGDIPLDTERLFLIHDTLFPKKAGGTMKKFKADDYSSINVVEADETSLGDAIGGDCFALMNSFDWEETPEGHDYWSEMYDKKVPLDTERLQLIYDTLFPHATSEDTPKEFNPVSKPSHYNLSGGIECIEYIKQVLGPDGFIAYCRGNSMKYQHRAMYKGKPLEDLEKAHQYSAWAIETLMELEE